MKIFKRVLLFAALFIACCLLAIYLFRVSIVNYLLRENLPDGMEMQLETFQIGFGNFVIGNYSFAISDHESVSFSDLDIETQKLSADDLLIRKINLSGLQYKNENLGLQLSVPQIQLENAHYVGTELKIKSFSIADINFSKESLAAKAHFNKLSFSDLSVEIANDVVHSVSLKNFSISGLEAEASPGQTGKLEIGLPEITISGIDYFAKEIKLMIASLLLEGLNVDAPDLKRNLAFKKLQLDNAEYIHSGMNFNGRHLGLSGINYSLADPSNSHVVLNDIDILDIVASPEEVFIDSVDFKGGSVTLVVNEDASIDLVPEIEKKSDQKADKLSSEEGHPQGLEKEQEEDLAVNQISDAEKARKKAETQKPSSATLTPVIVLNTVKFSEELPVSLQDNTPGTSVDHQLKILSLLLTGFQMAPEKTTAQLESHIQVEADGQLAIKASYSSTEANLKQNIKSAEKVEEGEVDKQEVVEPKTESEQAALEASAATARKHNEEIKLVLDARFIELIHYSLYAEQNIGFGISSGQADLELELSAINQQINGEADLFLRKLYMETVDEKKADAIARQLTMPLPVALKMLKDRQGDIELEIPIEGDYENQDIGYNSIVEILGKKIIGIVTKKYLISAIFPGGLLVDVASVFAGTVYDKATALPPVDFKKGDIEINDEGKKILENLANFLDDKDDVSVMLCPVVAIDEAGTEKLREKIAEQRSNKVKAFLEEKGIESTRLLLCKPVIDDKKNSLVYLKLK